MVEAVNRNEAEYSEVDERDTVVKQASERERCYLVKEGKMFVKK